MAYYTKQQVKQLLDNAPQGLDKAKIVESLVKQGNELEGLGQNSTNTQSLPNYGGQLPSDTSPDVNQGTPEKKSFGGFVGNIAKSGLNFVKDIGSAVIHPVDTVKSIGKVALGTAEKLVPGRQGAEDQADAVGKFFVDRYGSWDKVKETAYNDPIGFLADASTVLDLGGGALKTVGTISKADKLAEAGKVIGETSKFVEPMQAGSKASQYLLGRTGMAESVAKKLYESALKPSTKLSETEKTKILLTGLKEGIPVTEGGLKMTQNTIDAINGGISQMIKDAAEQGKEVSTASIRNKLDEVYDVVSKTVNPDSHIEDLAKVERDFISNYGESIPIDTAQEIKQNTYKILRKAYGEMKSTTVEGQKALARGIKEEIVKQYPEIGNLNTREGALLDFEDELQKAVNRINNHNLVGLGAIGAGGIGAIAGGAGGGILIGATKAVLDNPAVKSKLGILLQKVADKGVLKGKIRQGVTNLSRVKAINSK